MFCLGIIIWQDIRTRTISWWTLPPLAISLFLVALHHSPWFVVLVNTAFNFVLLALNFFLLWVWFILKRKKYVSPINTFIGIGDILFFACLTFGFSIPDFMLLYIGGLLVALVIAFFIRMLSGNAERTIPLAAYAALPVMLVCLVRLAKPESDLYDTGWIRSFLGGV
jgi:hypothetical protein